MPLHKEFAGGVEDVALTSKMTRTFGFANFTENDVDGGEVAYFVN